MSQENTTVLFQHKGCWFWAITPSAAEPQWPIYLFVGFKQSREGQLPATASVKGAFLTIMHRGAFTDFLGTNHVCNLFWLFAVSGDHISLVSKGSQCEKQGKYTLHLMLRTLFAPVSTSIYCIFQVFTVPGQASNKWNAFSTACSTNATHLLVFISHFWPTNMRKGAPPPHFNITCSSVCLQLMLPCAALAHLTFPS